ncbi:MAG: protein-L-isoaspartate(D-aspartate) O-methyltransferase [Legionellales bacterium]|nr:protein-L-isoaspartate(D-aspartate) O-methyltransferase [Legionellales bacterium]
MNNLNNMLTEQITARGIKNQDILNAMLKYPRELFIAADVQEHAYDDAPLHIGYGQTISQPYIVAFMLDILELTPSCNVLEIGAGSGYQAALLAALSKQVTSIEIIPELAASAQQKITELEIKNLTIENSNGYNGWEQNAPYDRIIVAAAAPFIPEKLIEQLAPAGKIVIPVGKQMHPQQLKIINKDVNSDVSESDSIGVRFVPLIQPPGK